MELTGKACPAFGVKLLNGFKDEVPKAFAGRPFVLHFYNSG